jgi:hypothetical protein
MNLENLGLVELNAQEVKEVDGGNPIVRFLWDVLVGEAVVFVYNTPSAPVHSGGTYAPYPGVSVPVK